MTLKPNFRDADFRSRPKALPVFRRGDERLNHIRAREVPIELIQLRQPEIIAGVVSSGASLGLRRR